MKDKEIKKVVRGELENLAKDAIDFFQKTGMVIPPSLNMTVERIHDRYDILGYLQRPKLTLISDEEIMSHANDEVQHTYGWTRDVILSGAHVIAQAQLDHNLKEQEG